MQPQWQRVRKKPVIVKAFQWDGYEVEGFRRVLRYDEVNQCLAYNALEIPTLEGDIYASIGDWIIQGVKGEHYPCKPDIFEATYDLVDG